MARRISIMADYADAWVWEGSTEESRLGPCTDVGDEISGGLYNNFVDWQAEFERAPVDEGRLPAWAERESAEQAERMFAAPEPESALKAAERIFADSEYNKRLRADPDYAEPTLVLDWDAFHRRGLELTKRLKAQLGLGVVVHYHVPCEDTRSSWTGQVFEIQGDGSVMPIEVEKLRRA